MRTLRTKYLSDIPIDEDNYKVDFLILEKYQNFSSEVLRLSLLGLTIYGFLIVNVIFKITDKQHNFVFVAPFNSYKIVLFLGAVALILTALSALSHRYFSTDCMTHFIRRFRLRQRLSELEKSGKMDEPEFTKIEESIKVEELSFENDLTSCKWLLFASVSLLIIGILLITIGLAFSFNNILK